jgi:hypothetical protein
VALTSLALMACTSDELLDVDNPDVIEPGKLETAQGAATLYAGTLADFAQAHDGSSDGSALGLFGGVVMTSGLFTDEFRFGGTPPEVRQLDLTDVTKENSFFRTTYLAMHQVREGAERAARTLESTGNGAADKRIGEMHAVSGLIVTLIGELFCEGLPSVLPQAARSNTARRSPRPRPLPWPWKSSPPPPATAAGDCRRHQPGSRRARSRPPRCGQFAEAGAAVAAVPTAFEYVTNHGDAPSGCRT